MISFVVVAKYIAKLNSFKGTAKIPHMRGERRIQDRLASGNELVFLEYGVPLDTVPYKKIWEKIDENYDDAITNEAIKIVENEKNKGKPGAIVVRHQINEQGTDNVEVWSWVD